MYYISSCRTCHAQARAGSRSIRHKLWTTGPARAQPSLVPSPQSPHGVAGGGPGDETSPRVPGRGARPMQEGERNHRLRTRSWLSYTRTSVLCIYTPTKFLLQHNIDWNGALQLYVRCWSWRPNQLFRQRFLFSVYSEYFVLANENSYS